MNPHDERERFFRFRKIEIEVLPLVAVRDICDVELHLDATRKRLLEFGFLGVDESGEMRAINTAGAKRCIRISENKSVGILAFMRFPTNVAGTLRNSICRRSKCRDDQCPHHAERNEDNGRRSLCVIRQFDDGGDDFRRGGFIRSTSAKFDVTAPSLPKAPSHRLDRSAHNHLVRSRHQGRFRPAY